MIFYVPCPISVSSRCLIFDWVLKFICCGFALESLTPHNPWQLIASICRFLSWPYQLAVQNFSYLHSYHQWFLVLSSISIPMYFPFIEDVQLILWDCPFLNWVYCFWLFVLHNSFLSLYCQLISNSFRLEVLCFYPLVICYLDPCGVVPRWFIPVLGFSLHAYSSLSYHLFILSITYPGKPLFPQQ